MEELISYIMLFFFGIHVTTGNLPVYYKIIKHGNIIY